MPIARQALARFGVAAVALWVVPAFSEPADPASAVSAAVSDIRHWSLSGSTRVAIELTGQVSFHYEGLSNPERLFIDLSGARLALRGKGLRVISVGDELIRQIRVAETRPQVVRVVLDLTGPADYEITQLTNPSRVMVEVRTKGRTPAVVSSAAPPPASEPQAEKPKPAPPAPRQATTPAVEHKTAEQAAVVETAPPARSPEPAADTSTRPSGPKAEPADLAAAPKPAKSPTRGRPSMTRALGLKLGKVVVDAGHGGQDHGTTGPSGLTEKELVLDVALRLGALIEQRMGSEVLYTRSEDVFIPLEERTAFANQNRADLFISIHANSSSLKHISGSEVYFLNFTSNRDALEVAARENAATGKSIFELRELLQKIALKDKRDESREFAAKVQSSLHATWYRMNPRARNRGVKQAPFVVLIGANMPSILTEIGFISNPRDEGLLKKPEHRQRLAEGLFRGISQYASTLSQLEVAHRAPAP